jgi:hypothetical protein
MFNYETSNCPHCFSQADTWFDRSCIHDENGKPLPYEEFPTRCSDCGRNVDAPRSHYGLSDIRYVSFDVHLPATKVLDSKYLETVKIPVYEKYNEDFLTPEAHLIIEGSKLRAMFKQLFEAEEDYVMFMNCPQTILDGLTPEEALCTADGQLACIVLASDLGLYKPFSARLPKIKRPLQKL